jgi:hypothetical protein
MSQEDFRKCLPKLSNSQLKQLFKQIPEFIEEKGITGELMNDLIRKQTKIQYEMQRRQYLTTKDNGEFNLWQRSKKVKKVW